MFSCTTQFGVLPLLHSCCCFFCVPVPESKIFCFQSKNDAHTHSHKHKQARSVSPHTTTNHTKVSSQKKKEEKKTFLLGENFVPAVAAKPDSGTTCTLLPAVATARGNRFALELRAENREKLVTKFVLRADDGGLRKRN